MVPSPPEGVLVDVGLIEVPLEDRGSPGEDLAGSPGRDVAVVVVDHTDPAYRAGGPRRPRPVAKALQRHPPRGLGLPESAPEVGRGLRVQALDGVRGVEPVDDPKRREAAPLLLRLVEDADQHRREVADEREAVKVDEPHRVGGVEARHHHVLAARVHHCEAAAEGRDVEEGEGQQVAVAGDEPHRGRGLEVGGDDVGVGEHGAPRDDVDRRGGNDRKGVVSRDLGPVHGGVRGSKPVDPKPSVRRLAVDLGPQDHLLESRSVLRKHRVVRLVDDEGARPGALARTGDLVRREPPVEGVGDDSLAGAGEVELEVGRGVLGDYEHPIPFREPGSGEPGREGIHPVPEGGEREGVSTLGDEGAPAGEAARIAGEEIVDGEALNVHECVAGVRREFRRAYHRPGVPRAWMSREPGRNGCLRSKVEVSDGATSAGATAREGERQGGAPPPGAFRLTGECPARSRCRRTAGKRAPAPQTGLSAERGGGARTCRSPGR